MKDKPKDKLISIIIPIYNVEEYLVKCLESAINQTYKNIEIILVNDGSKDNSGEICERYKEKDNRIIVVHKQNGGLSSARNEGIKIAKGEYISFLDSDDWISEDFIEILMDLIIENDASIAVSEYEPVYSEEDIIKQQVEIIKVYTNEEALDIFTNSGIIFANGKMYARELFDNIIYPIGKIHEDEFVFHRIFYEAKKVVYTNRKMYLYRQREGSIMNSKFSLKRLDAIEAFEDRIEFYKTKRLMKLVDKTDAIYIYTLKKIMVQLNESDVENREEIINKIYDKLIIKYRDIKINKYIKMKNYIYIKLSLMFPYMFKKLILLRGLK